MAKVKKKRNYKKEYREYQGNEAQKNYRVKLNRYNRKKGTYGNSDGLDASHDKTKGRRGRIKGFEKASKNRARNKRKK